MMLQIKLANRLAKAGRLALSVACAALLTGFSNPQAVQNKSVEGKKEGPVSGVQTDTPLVLSTALPAAGVDSAQGSNLSEPLRGTVELFPVALGNTVFNDFKIRLRLASFADSDMVSNVLADLDSRLWLTPVSLMDGVREVATQHESQNALRQTTINGFQGVGFPDIRTYKRTKRSPFDAPGAWAPLVTWRDLQGGEASSQPIARVRCMGLSPQAVAKRADRYMDTIYLLADRYDVDARLIKAVIAEESCFNDKALSVVGAQGLMQLMPDTATWLKVSDPLDPQQNLKGGISYLASLQKEFNSIELVLAAYNAGPGNVRRYDGIPPFAETQAYVRKVQANYRRYEAAHRLLYPSQEAVSESDGSEL